MTHTYAVLDISSSAFHEIRSRLLAGGHLASGEASADVLDMNGLALMIEEPRPKDGNHHGGLSK